MDKYKVEFLPGLAEGAPKCGRPRGPNWKPFERGGPRGWNGFGPKAIEALRAKQAILSAQAAVFKRVREIKEEFNWRRKNRAIEYYAVKKDAEGNWRPGKMNRPQEQFHRMAKGIRILSAANRVGKTTAGLNEDVAWALGYRPWLAEGDPDRKVNVVVPNKGVIIGESFQEQVKKVIIPKLLGDPEMGTPGAVRTEDLADVRRNPQGVITWIKLKNGSQIYLQSYDQDLELFESSQHHWAHFDEPPPRPIWVAVQRGLTDTVGSSWLTMTPLSQAWIYDELLPREDVGVVYATIEENLGFGLTQEGIDKFKRDVIDPDAQEARLRGRFFHLVGLVYKVYGQVHKVKRRAVWPDGICPNHWPVWMHIDTHPRKPHHAVWLTVAPDQRKYVCGELKNADPANKISPFCEAIKYYEWKMFAKRTEEIERLMEPLASTPNPVGEGISVWDEFARCMGDGWYCKPGSKNRDAGILLMQDALAHDPDKGIYPMLYFMDDLPGVHYEMTHYVWDEWKGLTAQNKNPKEVPVAKANDYIEGIHRILLEEPVYQEIIEQASRPREQGTVSVTGY